jgi:hypothetical protein
MRRTERGDRVLSSLVSYLGGTWFQISTLTQSYSGSGGFPHSIDASASVIAQGKLQLVLSTLLLNIIY